MRYPLILFCPPLAILVYSGRRRHRFTWAFLAMLLCLSPLTWLGAAVLAAHRIGYVPPPSIFDSFFDFSPDQKSKAAKTPAS